MKTFQEVIGLFNQKYTNLDDILKTTCETEEIARRYKEFDKEVTDYHEKHQEYLMTIASHSCCEFHALLTCFYNGLIMGMEMQRGSLDTIKGVSTDEI